MKKYFTPFLVVLALGLAFFSGSMWQRVRNLERGSNSNKTATPTPKPVTSDTIKEAFAKAVIKFGEGSAKLIFTEISDPSCPYCSIAVGKNPKLNREASSPQYDFRLISDGGTFLAPVPEIKKLVDSGKASYAVIYFPGHGSGELAMKALYCAFEEGKYWPVHDLLMSGAGYDLINNQVQNEKAKADLLTSFLKSAINSKTLKSCLDSGKYDGQIILERELGANLIPAKGGTPTFYVNTIAFPGAHNFKDLEGAVKEALGETPKP